jgi:hypothetical protein
MALWFDSKRMEEGGSRQHTARRWLCRMKEGDDPLGGQPWARVATLTGLQLGQSGLN